MTETNQLEAYKPHEGTVLISKFTRPNKAAGCIERYIAHEKSPIDIFYIGANAGQQAMKTMGIVAFNTNLRTRGKLAVVYTPRRVRTLVENENVWKDATVWTLFLLDAEILQ